MKESEIERNGEKRRRKKQTKKSEKVCKKRISMNLDANAVAYVASLE